MGKKEKSDKLETLKETVSQLSDKGTDKKVIETIKVSMESYETLEKEITGLKAAVSDKKEEAKRVLAALSEEVSKAKKLLKKKDEKKGSVKLKKVKTKKPGK